MLHLYMYIDTTFAVAKRKRDKNSGLYRISYSYSLSCSALTARANNYQPNGSRSCSFVSCTVYGPWSRVKIINLNVLPESSCNKLKYSLKTSFMFLSIILKFQAPDKYFARNLQKGDRFRWSLVRVSGKQHDKNLKMLQFPHENVIFTVFLVFFFFS